MKRRAVSLMGVAALLVLLLAVAAQATVLEFDTLTSAGFASVGGNTHPGYGDNVTATSDAFGSYLEGNGFTPDITTDYKNLTFAVLNNGLTLWAGSSAGTVLGLNTNVTTGFFTLIAAAGHEVRLNSFDVGSFGDQSTTLFQVLDHTGSVLVDYAGSFSGSSLNTKFPDVTDSKLTVTWANWNLGLNNVNFDETTAAVPVPPALWLFGSGLVGLAGFGRRFRQKA
ncbi:MAG: hypothetical protein ACYC6G_08970 [Desulfobaccales bacterium]